MGKKLRMMEVDADRIKTMIKEQGMTQQEFSYSIGRSNAYISNMHGKTRIYENVANLICEKLGVQSGYFDYVEKDDTNFNEFIKLLHFLEKSMKDINTKQEETEKTLKRIEDGLHRIIIPLTENVEAVRKKIGANTVQIEKVKELLTDMQRTNTDDAQDFLREILKSGQADGQEILLRADALGFKRADIMKAKKILGVEIVSRGYGANQKAVWMMK